MDFIAGSLCLDSNKIMQISLVIFRYSGIYDFMLDAADLPSRFTEGTPVTSDQFPASRQTI